MSLDIVDWKFSEPRNGLSYEVTTKLNLLVEAMWVQISKKTS